MDASKTDEIFNSTANWKLASGSLTDSISFESSSFSTTAANPESDDGTISAAVNYAAKSPLLLLPPFPDCDPCEITIRFAQEHEVRQIYIRSSAKVYEVYYTKKRRNDKEYLCTVRCGLALREEEEEDPVVKDDWIEVKSGDNEKDLLPIPQFQKQDLFEATAEINDAEPCISITLRLLSLQDKSCALVDEVYVFADPIDQTELEQEEANRNGNSSTSSLMAMFMPTLLQLSRAKDVRKEREIQVSEKSNDSGKIVNEIQPEKSFSKADHKGVNSPVLVDPPTNNVDEIRVPAMSSNNVETMLHQLVNKVSSIETFLTRFEDQMLKPINSIDARLQLVERKLEQLEQRSFGSELLAETKAPNPVSLDSEKTDKTPETNTDNPLLSSCAEIAVPDSSSIDNSEDYAAVPKSEEQGIENNSISGTEVNSAESEINNEEVSVIPKRSLSVNDALASALAGLLSSTSIADRKYSQGGLVVTAPEFPNEDEEEMKTKSPTGSHQDKSLVAAEEFGNTLFNSESPTSSKNEPEITLCIEDGSQELVNGVSKTFCVSINDDAETPVKIGNNDIDDEEMLTSMDLDSSSHELENANITAKESKGESGMDDVLKSFLGFQSPTTTSVDFLTPVLDVKFNSDMDNKCFFEELLTSESKTGVLDFNSDKALGDSLVLMEDEEEEVKGPLTDTLSSLEMDHYETNEMQVDSSAEVSTASLI